MACVSGIGGIVGNYFADNLPQGDLWVVEIGSSYYPDDSFMSHQEKSVTWYRFWDSVLRENTHQCRQDMNLRAVNPHYKPSAYAKVRILKQIPFRWHFVSFRGWSMLSFSK